MATAARYAFRLELPNELAGGVSDTFHLFYYAQRHPSDDELEIYDPKKRRAFLKRCHVPGFRLDDIVLGSRVTIYGRQYIVVDFEDELTRRALGVDKERAVAIISMEAIGTQLCDIEASGLKVVNVLMFTPSETDAQSLSSAITGFQQAAGVPHVALDIQGSNAHSVLLQLATAGLAVSHTRDLDSRLRKWLFSSNVVDLLPSVNQPKGRLSDCSCVVILPSAVARKQAGPILSDLLIALGDVDGNLEAAGYAASTPSSASVPGRPLTITAMAMTSLSRQQAERFSEVYKGVLREYTDLTLELCSGPLVALEVSGPEAVARVREIVGPRDVEVGKRVRPSSLRARYGDSPAKPAVHCTDLPEDGPLECEAFFGGAAAAGAAAGTSTQLPGASTGSPGPA